MERFYSIRATAKKLGISPQTLKNAIYCGDLVPFRMGKRTIYLTESAITIWMKSKRFNPRTAAEATANERWLAKAMATPRSDP